ncbi:MAG: restriction endonuclease [Campylobacteraceae bacterium]|nr:restriction endonuclease [Campylobacteraceae bacterium]
MLEMIIASFLKIWHLIPLIIFIILLKKFVNNKDKKSRINKNDENEKNGLTLEVRTQKNYENLGYEVKYQKKQENTEEIDLVCKRDNKILLIQCKNDSKTKSITEDDIKTFYKNALQYLKTNDIEKKDAQFRYVVAYSDVLHKSAIKILRDDFYNCKYVVL